jgi:hypothetical protein
MQTIVKEKEVTLGIPKFEKPVKTYIPKPITVTKPSWFQRLFKKIFG